MVAKNLLCLCRSMVGTRKRKQTTTEEPDLRKKAKKVDSSKEDNKLLVQPPATTKDITSLSSLVKEPSWSENLQDLFNTENFKKIENFLNDLWTTNQTTFPPKELIFEAFNKTPFDKVKVVLLGQDPYHDDGQVNARHTTLEKQLTLQNFLGSWTVLLCTKDNDNITTLFKKHI